MTCPGGYSSSASEMSERSAEVWPPSVLSESRVTVLLSEESVKRNNMESHVKAIFMIFFSLYSSDNYMHEEIHVDVSKMQVYNNKVWSICKTILYE